MDEPVELVNVSTVRAKSRESVAGTVTSRETVTPERTCVCVETVRDES